MKRSLSIKIQAYFSVLFVILCLLSSESTWKSNFPLSRITRRITSYNKKKHKKIQNWQNIISLWKKNQMILVEMLIINNTRFYRKILERNAMNSITYYIVIHLLTCLLLWRSRFCLTSKREKNQRTIFSGLSSMIITNQGLQVNQQNLSANIMFDGIVLNAVRRHNICFQYSLNLGKMLFYTHFSWHM